MNSISQTVMRAWAGLGPGFLPFADAATPDVPLSRLAVFAFREDAR